MSVKISLVGKGGTGKTTVSALLINYLIEKQYTPILAVDADPNYNLNELLGIKEVKTLSEIREEVLAQKVPDFMSRYEFVEIKVNEILVEKEGFDLLVMGYPETAGCYCPIHSFLSQALTRLFQNYPYVIIDNEAGMEHISRLNLTQMDHLIIVSDPNPRGIVTAERIWELVKALKVEVKKSWLLVNKAPTSLEDKFIDLVKKTTKAKNLNLLGFLPEEQDLLEYELKTFPVFKWDSDFKTYAYQIFDKLWEN
ncbi:AAA family ATPase [Thermodesulfobacterium sp. TA1]|uniref:ATP-binding protein n=1 Tax=Thermodesulfobacterium sp. TA1 TaxID=2234087 RepID=UPI001232450E|nr:AAA family ATPase [Thermodesulfobacterium sp. TA1]QER41439.1 AAA family ATPase [Thermodesulfobacterium sp. TA1]